MDVPSCSSSQIIRAAHRLGFVIKQGGKGSHIKLEHQTSGRVIVVPQTKDVGKGLRTQIVKELSDISGKSLDEVIALLSTGVLFVLLESLRQLFRW